MSLDEGEDLIVVDQRRLGQLGKEREITSGAAMPRRTMSPLAFTSLLF
jgi:hypothetical protein